MKKPSHWIALIAALVFIAAAVWKITSSKPSAEMRRQNMPLVKVEPPRTETVSYTLSFTGDIQPLRQAGIYARVGGVLERVYVDAGSPVREGGLLAQIDTTELAQQRLQAAATRQNAEVVCSRTRELAAQNLISRQELDNAQTALDVAQATYESVCLRFGYAAIAAPFSGVITRRYFDPGALVTANNTLLFSLASFDTVKVIINVLEHDVPRVSPGMNARLTADAYPGKSFEGAIRRLSEAVDLDTRTMPVEVDVSNPDRQLKPGMFGTVAITLDEHPNALTIPTRSLLKDEQGWFVWVVRGATAVRMPVSVGAEVGDRTEVTSGLTLADSVVTAGIQLVRDKLQVTVKP